MGLEETLNEVEPAYFMFEAYQRNRILIQENDLKIQAFYGCNPLRKMTFNRYVLRMYVDNICGIIRKT